jgi:hypothetical protein
VADGKDRDARPPFYADAVQARSAESVYPRMMSRLPTPASHLALVLFAGAGLLAVAACASGAAPGSPGATGAGTVGPIETAAGSPSVLPVIVSSQQVVGPNRFVFSFLDPATNLPAATPDRTASVAFIGPGESQPGTSYPATFVWGIVGSRGDYVASVEFSKAGDWTAEFTTQPAGGTTETVPFQFQVQETGVTIAVGQQAPAAKTPTAADVGGDIAKIATDPSPDPSFYRLSVDQALAQHTPFVLVFATPAFCQSAQCGPTLDRVKSVAATSPSNVAFINVEPYKLQYADGRLQPVLDAQNQLQPVDAVNQWGLLSEPWIFTVDATGVVRGSFEGVVGVDELKAAIARIAGS